MNYLQSNLSGHKNIIGYVDSSITHTTGGIHELLLLMPYCKSQVLQMMNNRLGVTFFLSHSLFLIIFGQFYVYIFTYIACVCIHMCHI